MSNDNERDSMLDVFLFEENQLIDQLEEIMLETEKSGDLSQDHINEIFRIMHTIKGSSGMMAFNNISKLAHSVEDLFYYIRENKPENLDISEICDHVLSASDFIKQEVAKISEGGEADGAEAEIVNDIKEYLKKISVPQEPAASAGEAAQAEEQHGPETEETPAEQGTHYIVLVHFEEGGQMENLRAFTIVRNLKEIASEVYTNPADIMGAPAESILEQGFKIYFMSSAEQSQISAIFDEALFLKSYEMREVDSYDSELVELGILGARQDAVAQPEKAENPGEGAMKVIDKVPSGEKAQGGAPAAFTQPKATKLNLISVNVNKLDSLMNLVGELVISESMVTRNPDIQDLQLENFSKAARQLRLLTDELQDIVMSIRMVQIAGTFQKMQRIVRDMSHKLKKDVEFVTIGDDTEVDKNIIDHLSDPLMHLIRNAMDHGVEPEQERIRAGKAPRARITLSAQNTGGDVLISVSDDGRGLDKEKILKKAREQGLLKKPEQEMTDREIFALTLLPGFSTKEKITEFSGRGVGMDVVKQNIEEVGGSVSIKSTPGQGTTINIVIPLTLAIADAMMLSVGSCIYTLPTTTIKESFRAKESDIILDNMGNEMIMIRGNVYPIIRLHHIYGLNTDIKKLTEGILILAEGENKAACLFADKLLGEQQIVVKPLPQYLLKYNIKDFGVEGCTILGDGGISLILNAKNLINRVV